MIKDINFWEGKKVFITGHTGFKGAWLSYVLKLLGSKVYGYSLKPEKKSLFELAGIKKLTENSIFGDIRNFSKLKESIKRLIFVFGKHYYALEAEKAKKNIKDTAIIRIEEMSPFPAESLKTILSQYKNAKEYVWSQEEHRNMGAWSFVSARFENILGIKLKYTGRETASCVSGMSYLHAKEVKEILSKPFDKF